MNAGDTFTLRQVSLAAALGFDARELLATDDAATHIVYDKLIADMASLYRQRTSSEQHNTAIAIVSVLAEAWSGK